MFKNKKLATLIVILIVFILIIFIFALLFYNGILLFNNPSHEEYPIRGVDVSSYQGDIDWNILASQDISFAYIKATEGSSFVDEHFETNFNNAIKTNLKIGAYHFFSYDSSGITQAENFIKTVENADNLMPPVVDIEFYGDKEKNLPNKEDVQENLSKLLNNLEEHYMKKPIIYATQKSYDLYISGSYEDYPIWIRSIFTKPKLSDNRDWSIWQYTNRARLDGYVGEEKYIDMNVFSGALKDFQEFI